MSSYTPGSWQVEDHEDEFLIFGPGLAEQIAMVQVYDRFGRDHADANARLIAAAPDLLEALRAARPWLRGDDGHSERAAPIIAVVDAAITKAEGR